MLSIKKQHVVSYAMLKSANLGKIEMFPENVSDQGDRGQQNGQNNLEASRTDL